MTSAQSPHTFLFRSQESSDSEENLLCGIVSDLFVADNRRDGFAIGFPASVFSFPAKNEAVAAPGKLFYARYSIYPDIGKRTAFYNRDRLRLFDESHDATPGNVDAGNMTQVVSSWNCEISVTLKYLLDRYSATASAKQVSAAKNRNAVSNPRDISFSLAAFLPSRGFRYLCRATSPVRRKQLGRANAALLFSSCAPTDTRSAPPAWHTRPHAVEAIPAWGTLSHHCEATAT
jgi:hypothetical protein